MSHFVGLVFGFDHEELLEPYDENREVDVYVKYTKDEAVNVVRTKRIEDYEWALKVLEKHPNSESDWEKNHVQHAQKIIEEGFEISYENAWEEAKKWGYERDDEDNLLSTYNPDSKWDWYIEGGRWGGWLLLKEKDENGEPLTAIYATKNEVDWDAMKEQKRVPFCFVTPGGDWVECAEMGWFGMTFNDKDPKEWDEEFWNYVDSLHDEIPVTVVDFHI